MQNGDQARKDKPMYSTDVWLWRSIQQNAFALAKKRSLRIGDVLNLKAGMQDIAMY
jgi:hypothetical protein